MSSGIDVRANRGRARGECVALLRARAAGLAPALERAGREATRFGLVGVVGWIGGMKFTAYEAEGIAGFARNSPLLAWVYGLTDVRGFSAALGGVELLIALLLALGVVWRGAGVLGAVLAVGMFATTLSFMATTPGVFEPSLGFPALSVIPGQFLVKDLVLLGGSLWLLGDALAERRA